MRATSSRARSAGPCSRTSSRGVPTPMTSSGARLGSAAIWVGGQWRWSPRSARPVPTTPPPRSRAMATDPDEVRRFYADTVEQLVEHDREYRTDLLGTLESYLAHDCNMNATARAVYAHRHTVALRLARIRELTGLDPALGEDRE